MKRGTGKSFRKSNQLKNNKERREMKKVYHIKKKIGGAIGILSLCGLVALSAVTARMMLYPAASTHAENLSSAMSAEVGVNVKEYIKLAIDTDELALADSQGHTTITPDANGTQITGEVNVAVTTNTIKGYTLSIFTQDNSKSMTHSNSGVSTAIQSIDTVSGYDATTGASNLSNNTWGWREHLSGGYTNWFAVGENESNGTIIDSTDEDDPVYCAESDFSYPLPNANCASSAYNSYTIGFGAKLTSELPAGTYTNNVVFSAVAKSEGTKYTMNFNANGGTNTMGPRTVLSGSNIVMPSTGFTKDGYGIKGWAMVNNATTSTTPIFLAGQTVAINDLIAAAQTAGQSPATTNSFTVYAVWDVPYTIAFDGNGGTGEMGSQSVFQTAGTYTIPTSSFTKEGYNFLGWALSASDAESGTVAYTVGQTPTISALITAAHDAGQDVTAGTAGTIKLYAVWEEAIIYMQNFACSSIGSGETITAVDKRDGQEYGVYRIPTNATYYGTSTVANIAGKCIMTKDLNLGAVDSVSGASSSITAQGTMNLSPADSAFSTPTGSGESITVPTTTTSVTHGTPGSGDNNYANRQYRIDGTGNYAGRGYYTWGAAMLACPKNWRLPTSDEYNNSGSWEGSTTGLSAIVKGVNASTTISNITSSPWSFVLGGLYINGFGSAGSYGFYWSTTQHDSTNSYYLDMYSSIGLIRYNGNKSYGFAVRCIAD